MTLEDKFAVESGDVYLTSLSALVRVLVDQRRRDALAGHRTAGFVSGYPGSPLGGLDIELQRRRRLLEAHDIRHVSGLNEDLAVTAIWGSQVADKLPAATVDGVFGMWYGKAPGVDRSCDAFRHANSRGVGPLGGVLAIAGDDPDASSTVIPSDSTPAFFDLQMPVLYPADVQDILDLGSHGYALSRASGLWAGFKLVPEIADSAGTASVGPDRIRHIVPEVELDGSPFRPRQRMNEAGRRMLEAEHELVYGRLEVARAYGRANRLNRVEVDPPGATIGIVASGKTYFDLRQALEQLGLDDRELQRLGIRILRVGLLYPMHDADLRDFAAGLSEIIVVEEKRPFLELFVKDALYGAADRPAVVGKHDGDGQVLLPANGQLTADLIARAVGRRILARHPVPHVENAVEKLEQARPRRRLAVSSERSAFFCSGCPHNRSLVTPDDSLVGAGIGCHIMALRADRDDFGEIIGYTHMGAEGAQWVGMAPYTAAPHLFQNLGDGTFFHSGSLAVRFAVAQGVNITFKLLYNGAVGMTGGQDVQGNMPVPDLTRLLEAEGVKRILVTADDPSRYRGVRLASIAEVRSRDDLVAAQEELAKTSGVTVLIHDQLCAAEKRRMRKRGKLVEPTKRLFINERVCEACGDCSVTSNCLSLQRVETAFGPKTQIHQSSCNLDYSCALGDCPSFLTIEAKSATKARPEALEAPTDLPEPTMVVPSDGCGVHMSGIGGTGVVTVSQILATAAAMGGKAVRDLDLTGSSQKAGPVVSHLQIGGDSAVAATIAPGGADVCLIFDLLTATSDANLARMSPDRTIAVASTATVATGQMAVDPRLAFPPVADLRTEVDRVTRRDLNVYIEADRIAEHLLGSHMFSNMVLVGAAYQAGCIPIVAESIERAIRLNGTATEKNVAAFSWGRLAVVDPSAVEKLLPPSRSGQQDDTPGARRIVESIDASGELAEVLRIRVPDLVRYQNAGLASRYVELVRRTLVAECAVEPGRDRLALAVAVNLYKLTAYKDEYEVGRLLTDPEAERAVEAEFGPGARIRWNLHPPAARLLGLHKKVSVGSWFSLVLRSLHRMRRLRGTPFDPFGRTKVRRVERALVEHYRDLVEMMISELDGSNLELATTIASTPDVVRGYEQLKLASARQYLSQVEALCASAGFVPPQADVLRGLLVAEAGGASRV